MSDAELLSGLIGEIYDAALDPALWPAVLEQSSKFVQGCGAALYVKDSVNKSAIIDRNYSIGIEDRFTDRYLETYVKLDPATTAMFFFGVGEINSAADMLPLQELLETRFYKEWMQPQGLVDAASTLLDKSATSYAVFCVFRHERDGLVDQGCRHRMQLLAPHVRRAVLIGKTLQLKKAEAETLADTLNELSAGIFLVDAQARVIHANVSGHALLAEEKVMRAVGGRLLANDAAADQALREAIAGAEGGDRGLGHRAVALPMDNDATYVAHVLPLTSGARRKAGRGYAAVAAVFVRKAERQTPAAPEVIAKLYRLTPSELRVLLALFETGGVAGIAAALGISEATVKTHLRRLFEKTGTGRQADLVKLVAGFTGPKH